MREVRGGKGGFEGVGGGWGVGGSFGDEKEGRRRRRGEGRPRAGLRRARRARKCATPPLAASRTLSRILLLYELVARI